uniref:Uncharacterized protein n=1 Tax=Arundo donax TaxID=35708 RepID=A0A0A9A223_ARUDO
MTRALGVGSRQPPASSSLSLPPPRLYSLEK